jgi:hypothetical protein
MEAIKQLNTEPEAPPPPASRLRTCEECQAALDDEQRYCVRCGSRQPDVYDPAARYFASSARRRRSPARAGARPARPGAGAPRWAALFLALLPVAVALGVLVGKGNGNGNEDKLIDALRSQRGSVASTAAPAAQTTGASNRTGGALPSDFPLDKGYTVKLSTLPLRETDGAAVAKAKAAATAKGAKKVGLINPRQFKTRPSQGADRYVLYSGSFKAKGDAAKLLAGLKKKFPGAQVIAVESVNGSDGQGQALSKTQLGTAHKVTGFKPSAEKVKHDTNLVQQINRNTGQTYVQSQRGLPDQIVVGGDPGSAPAPDPGAAGQP